MYSDWHRSLVEAPIEDHFQVYDFLPRLWLLLGLYLVILCAISGIHSVVYELVYLPAVVIFRRCISLLVEWAFQGLLLIHDIDSCPCCTPLLDGQLVFTHIDNRLTPCDNVRLVPEDALANHWFPTAEDPATQENEEMAGGTTVTIEAQSESMHDADQVSEPSSNVSQDLSLEDDTLLEPDIQQSEAFRFDQLETLLLSKDHEREQQVRKLNERLEDCETQGESQTASLNELQEHHQVLEDRLTQQQNGLSQRIRNLQAAVDSREPSVFRCDLDQLEKRFINQVDLAEHRQRDLEIQCASYQDKLSEHMGNLEARLVKSHVDNVNRHDSMERRLTTMMQNTAASVAKSNATNADLIADLRLQLARCMSHLDDIDGRYAKHIEMLKVSHRTLRCKNEELEARLEFEVERMDDRRKALEERVATCEAEDRMHTGAIQLLQDCVKDVADYTKIIDNEQKGLSERVQNLQSSLSSHSPLETSDHRLENSPSDLETHCTSMESRDEQDESLQGSISRHAISAVEQSAENPLTPPMASSSTGSQEDDLSYIQITEEKPGKATQAALLSRRQEFMPPDNECLRRELLIYKAQRWQDDQLTDENSDEVF